MKRIVISMMLLLPLTACQPMAPAGTSSVQVQPSQAEYMPGTTVRAASDPTPSAVDTAMMWAERYTLAIADRDEAADRAREAEKGRDDAEKRLRELQIELEATRRQLDDADKMMRELKADLDNWKRDVLGFRKEMLDAQIVQLEALRQIMKVLGGELATPAGGESAEGEKP